MSDTMTVAELAREFRVQPKKLLPLLLKDYVKIVEPNAELGLTIIEKPLPEVREWLRLLYRPASLQPTIPFKDAAKAVKMTNKVARRLCQKHGIQIYKDLVFGELISAREFHKLCRLSAELEQEYRRDVQALVYYMAKLYGHSGIHRPRPFDKRFEDEITRIVELDEPLRTFEATKFWVNYNKAKEFVEAIDGGKPTGQQKYLRHMVEQRVKAVRLALDGRVSWNNPHKTVFHPKFRKSMVRANISIAVSDGWRKPSATSGGDSGTGGETSAA